MCLPKYPRRPDRDSFVRSERQEIAVACHYEACVRPRCGSENHEVVRISASVRWHFRRLNACGLTLEKSNELFDRCFWKLDLRHQLLTDLFENRRARTCLRLASLNQAFNERQPASHRDTFERFDSAARPADLDSLGNLVVTEAERELEGAL